MLAQTLFLVASAAVASAQISYNGSNIICPASAPNGNFCAGDSLSTNIIIRCVNGVAQPGNCNDNLAGEPPVGVNPAQCFQSSPTAGDAACAKNCIVYATTQTTLPNCTPTFTASSSSSTGTSTSSSPTTSPSTSTTTTSTGTTVITTGSTTLTKTFTTTFCPTTSATGTGPGTGTGTGSPAPPNNGTHPTTTGGNGGNGGKPTNTPSSPTTTASGFTGAAAATLSPMGLLAGAGLAVAYFL